MLAVVEKKRPGRPKTVTEIDYLRTQYWAHMALKLSKLQTMTALERLVSEHTFHKREDVGGYTYPNVFNKFASGKKKVWKDLVERTNLKVNGSSYYYYHPVWDLLDEKFSGLEGLYKLLASINTRLSDYLFHPESKGGGIRRRKKTGRNNFYTLTLFGSENDLDALAVILGLLYEARYYGENYTFIYIATRVMVSRLAVFTPIDKFVFHLLNVLDSNFNSNSLRNSDRRDCLSNESLAEQIEIGQYFVNYKKTNTMFKLFCPTHITYLNFLLDYLDLSTTFEITQLLDSNLESKLLSHPYVKQFFLEMEKWEQYVVERQDPFFNHNHTPKMVRLEPEFKSKHYTVKRDGDFSFPEEWDE